MLNAYTIVFAALLTPAGKLADRFGHRRAFLAGSTLFTVASMACGLSPTVELLIAFRVGQAAGAAVLIPASLALVLHAVPRERDPHAVAIWGAAGGIAGALGPTLGSAIIEALDWRCAFFINLPIGAFTILAGRRHLGESSDPHTLIPSMTGVGSSSSPRRRSRTASSTPSGRAGDRRTPSALADHRDRRGQRDAARIPAPHQEDRSPKDGTCTGPRDRWSVGVKGASR